MSFNNVNVNVCGGQSIIKALQNYNTIILKPNIVDNRNVLTQEMMSERHTKYIIRWNYSLEDATINVPEDCIVEFAGGTIDNGTIVGNNTMLMYSKPIDEVCLAERQGTFIYNTTVADEEDITSANGQLKFKDRPATDGMGRKILRKNIVNGVNTLTQEMISDANTIYIIQYDFTLGEDITVPANCVLEFDGGSVSGAYTVTGNNTGINAGLVKIFSTEVTLAGTWNIAEAYPEWFGDYGLWTNTEDLFKLSFDIQLQGKTYYAPSSPQTLNVIGKIHGIKRATNSVNGTVLSISPLQDNFIGVQIGEPDLTHTSRPKGYGLYDLDVEIVNTGIKRSAVVAIGKCDSAIISECYIKNNNFKSSELTSTEFNNPTDYLNYGIIINGSNQFFNIFNSWVTGDIGIWFKDDAWCDFFNVWGGAVSSYNYGFSCLYGKVPVNTSFFNVSFNLGIYAGYFFNGDVTPSEMNANFFGCRIEQLRSYTLDSIIQTSNFYINSSSSRSVIVKLTFDGVSLCPYKIIDMRGAAKNELFINFTGCRQTLTTTLDYILSVVATTFYLNFNDCDIITGAHLDLDGHDDVYDSYPSEGLETYSEGGALRLILNNLKIKSLDYRRRIYGNSYQRPKIANGFEIGFRYYDTSLKKPIYWNGTKWVEEDGVTAGIARSGNTRPSYDNTLYVGFMFMDTSSGIEKPIFIKSIGHTQQVITWVDATGATV